MKKTLTVLTLVALSTQFSLTAKADGPSIWAWDVLVSFFESDDNQPLIGTIGVTVAPVLLPLATTTAPFAYSSASKRELVQQAAPSAALYLKDKTITEDFLAASSILLDEKAEKMGTEEVDALVEGKKISPETLARDIIKQAREQSAE